jgi:hypothetical protein
MASVAQVLANRSNAQKSTGPRTTEGKAIVAQNAVKHGLLTQRVVVKGEDPQEFALFREQMLEDLEPVGSVETILAERVVNLGWRLGRATRLEGALFATLEAKHVPEATIQRTSLRPQGVGPGSDEAGAEEESVLARVVVKDFGGARVLDQLLGYERRIENSLYRTMNELRKQRLLREAESSEGAPKRDTSRLGSQFRLQAGQESLAPAEPASFRVNAVLSTATPGGATTNGADPEIPSCETKPIGMDSLQDQTPSGAAPEEIGRGRPSYEEGPSVAPPPSAVIDPSRRRMGHPFRNPEPSCGVTTNNEVSSLECEVSSEQSQTPGPASLSTSNFTLQTPGTECQVASEPG